MAYTIAFNFMEKRIKFSVQQAQASSLSQSQAPSTAVSENIQMQPQQE